MLKHSTIGKISFISLCTGLFFFLLRILDLAFSKYSNYNTHPIFSNVGSIINFVLIISALISFISGVIGAFQKNTKKIFPTISLSITGFILFIFLLFLIEESILRYNVKEGTITNYGVFDIPTLQINKNKTKSLFEKRYLVENTDEIKASIGTRFGFNYVIDGEPNSKSIRIMKIINYPEIGMKKDGKIIHSDTSYFSIFMNSMKYTDYKFNYDYQIIPGSWEFEIWYDQKKLLSKKFDVRLQ